MNNKITTQLDSNRVREQRGAVIGAFLILTYKTIFSRTIHKFNFFQPLFLYRERLMHAT
jgi:hypothetical protein